MVDWSSFYTGLASFAGTVFALTLVARTIRRSDEANESVAQNRVRLWDSISVTYELAAAALLAILVPIRLTAPGVALALVVVAGGLYAYTRYLYEFGRWVRSTSTPPPVGQQAMAALTALPVTAYALCAAHFLGLPTLFGWSVELVIFPLGVGYLALSGTGQALLWYLKSWEYPSSRSD